MDMFGKPRCACCENKTQIDVKDNKITLSGNINCCFVKGLLWYLKPCCFISFVCGGKQGIQLDEDIRREMFNVHPKKESFVELDGKRHLVYQVDNKVRNVKMLDHRSFIVVNDIVLTEPDEHYHFMSKKDFDSE